MTSRRAITLAARPAGPLRADDFMFSEATLPPLRDGEVLVRVRLLSMDPYLRTAMDERPVVGPSIPIGAVVPGRGIGEVVESRAASVEPGQLVLGELGWQDYGVVETARLRVIRPSRHPLSWHLGVLGVPGMTALLSLQLIGTPKENETILVSSAAGGVGSAAGQIAKAFRCKTIGVTSRGKIELCRTKFGFDHCIARDTGDLARELSAVTDGLDIVLDNTGDDVIAAALPLMRSGGRIILTGRLAHYERSASPATGPLPFEAMLLKQLRVEGFNIRNHVGRFGEALARLEAFAEQGLLQQVDSVVHGLAAAPDALDGLLTGRYVGKVIVEL